MSRYHKQVEIRWSDIDANQHMRHTAYADLCTHTRLEWLQDAGFGADRFFQLGFGPVIFKETTEYLREVKLGMRLDIDVVLVAASADHQRGVLRQQMVRDDGKLAAHYEVAGAWLDLSTRKLTTPPAELQAIFDDMPRSEDYHELPLSRVKP